MTDDKKQILKVRMAALHEKYCKQLPEKYLVIESCWNEYKTDLNNAVFIERFYRLIHTLKGTAATFGFNTQADICFEIQKLLLDVKENLSALDEHAVIEIQKQLAELKANISIPADDSGED